jgi:PKD repeat protein
MEAVVLSLFNVSSTLRYHRAFTIVAISLFVVFLGLLLTQTAGALKYDYIHNASTLTNWTAARADLKSGSTAIYDIVVAGDSISEGSVAGVPELAYPANYYKYLTLGYPGLLRNYYSTLYDDTGYGFIPSTFKLGGSQYFTNTNWPKNPSTGMSFAGYDAKTTTNGATITGYFNGTGLKFYYQSQNAVNLGNVSWNIDNGANMGEWDEGIYKATFFDTKNSGTVADGLHTATLTANITAPDNNAVFSGWQEQKGSTGVRINNVAYGGAVVRDFNRSSYIRPLAFSVFGQKVSIIMIGANDHAMNTTPEWFRTNLTNVIAEAHKYGDVIVMSPPPSGLPSEYSMSDYVAIVEEEAGKAGVCYIDMYNYWGGDFAYANETLRYMADRVHPNTAGHASIYDMVLTVLEGIPEADFTATPTSGTAPATVHFDSSIFTGLITQTLWNFGNGHTSIEANPTYTYHTAGNYTVTLTVSNDGGSSTMTKTNYIRVYGGFENNPYNTTGSISDTLLFILGAFVLFVICVGLVMFKNSNNKGMGRGGEDTAPLLGIVLLFIVTSVLVVLVYVTLNYISTLA